MTERLEAALAVDVLGALAQATRLEIFRLLMRYRPHGLAAGDIGRLLAVAHNTLSTHLSALEHVGLLVSRREGRHIIFAAQPARADSLLNFLSDACCTERPTSGLIVANSAFPSRKEVSHLVRPLSILVVCTGNSARSIMAETVLNREGSRRINAYSAGSRPQEAPHPLALQQLDELGYDVSATRSKSWDEFLQPDAPKLDLVITVCDGAAEEGCPTFPGVPVRVHWGLDDPAEIVGPLEARRAAFRKSYRELAARVSAFVNLPFETMSVHELEPLLIGIGTMDGATGKALEQAA